MSYKERYHQWLDDNYFDQETKEELESIAGDEAEIEDRFYTDLEFGTGGMRGVIGAGTNRINKYTIRKATQGLANYILKQLERAKDQGVVIAHDSRFKSSEFALETAAVLNGNGIKIYLFSELRPTPELSFAVRELGAAAGIVITASHNPAEYNGYKVYWSDEGQIVPRRAEGITAEIEEITDYTAIKHFNREKAKKEGLFKVIGAEIDDRYIEKLKTLVNNPEVISEIDSDFKIIYTPLHGSGNKLVPRILKEIGFSDVQIVPEQKEPDPNFPTVDYPNPEEKSVFKLALEMAEEEKPDLILGTDPDADRLGLLLRRNDDYISLTGNQIGVLLMDYLLSQRKKQQNLPNNGAVVKTIVTTELARDIAEEYGVGVIDTLTGFKFIGEKIKEFEESNEQEFLFGFEESYGYLAGTFVRDKDAVMAAALVAEMAAYYKAKGLDLYQKLEKLMDRHGYYLDDLESIVLKGKEGQQQIEKILDTLRSQGPKRINGRKVTAVRDYLTGIGDLPKSNVLQFDLEDGSKLTIRPSGTEPKLKLYFTAVGESWKEAENKLSKLKDELLNMVQDII
ncbi:phospho-sugar mutase [Sporohalobacter salinus]|uniref:phospho-sugar mutase n=1 Tax=Sporohalobacter salinus TaxID=1494606 RepID=UPI00196169A4|nr:phospho-sugar mutase [Sporohalobacter salinus]MBM7623001.1 phosphoglucomutase [Sporohalobacter salinus]